MFNLIDFCFVFQTDVIKVLVTGAAGQIAYSLLYSVAKGDVFGANQVCKKLSLHLMASHAFI